MMLLLDMTSKQAKLKVHQLISVNNEQEQTNN